jgi:ABC-type polysaccharide/polyol phosphate export permease
MAASPLSPVHALWRSRDLFLTLTLREVRARYKGSWLGFLWALLNPLLMMGVYAVVFSHVMRVQVPHYTAFLLAGLLPWAWFSAGVGAAAASVTANAALVRKVRFPHEVLPLVAIATHGIQFLLALPVLLGLLVWHGLWPGLALAWLPVVMGVQFLLAWGLGLLLATANAYFRDVEQLLGPVLMAWFYLTPIVYPATFLPPAYRPWLGWNPLTAVFTGYQGLFLEGRPPALGALAASAAVGVALTAVGWGVLRARRTSFAEVV